jgi:hypothetical protein
LGTLVGTITGPLTILLADFSRHQRIDKTNRTRRERLLKISGLPDRKFVSLTYLARAVAADEKTTAQLLLEVGARHLSRKWAS